MTIKSLIHWATQELTKIDSARLDAELILGHVLKKDSTYLFTHDDERISFFDVFKYKRLIKKRKKYFPVAYILGKKEFYGLQFSVSPHVLIPRPDTEILVEVVLAYLKPGDFLLDVGTGSGCIPISILKSMPEIQALATDISNQALNVAWKNAKQHEVLNRLQFFHSNLLEHVPADFFKERNIIVTANLPYVPRNYQINEEAKFEPTLALYAEENGLDLYKKLLDQLKEIGPKAIFLECYEFQLALLAEHLEGYKLRRSENMLGEARLLMLERS